MKDQLTLCGISEEWDVVSDLGPEAADPAPRVGRRTVEVEYLQHLSHQPEIWNEYSWSTQMHPL